MGPYVVRKERRDSIPLVTYHPTLCELMSIVSGLQNKVEDSEEQKCVS